MQTKKLASEMPGISPPNGRNCESWAKLFSNFAEKAALEARNGLLQFDEVQRIVDGLPKTGFRLRPPLVRKLQQIAIQDIHTCAGNYRTGMVYIASTSHVPPAPGEVPGLVEEICGYVNDNWQASALHLAAYSMWRVNWIHPFTGGNGRTSRAVSYLVLCARLGYRLPGVLTIPEQIVANREPYYQALDAAAEAWAAGKLDVGRMEVLLSEMLAGQLLPAHRQARGGPSGRAQ